MAKRDRAGKHPALKELGYRMQDARRRSGMTQEQVALSANVERAYVGMIERAERSVTLLTFIRICTAMQADPGDVLKGLSAAPKEEK